MWKIKGKASRRKKVRSHFVDIFVQISDLKQISLVKSQKIVTLEKTIVCLIFKIVSYLKQIKQIHLCPKCVYMLNMQAGR